MTTAIASVAGLAASLIEAAAVIVVFFGSLEAFLKILWIGATPGATHGERKGIWRRFGMWLLLGLEFETFLNYFLEQDLERATAAG